MSAADLVPEAELTAWVEEIPGPVAVTGGTGFVGSHLVEALVKAGVRPRVLLRDLDGRRWLEGVDVEAVAGDLHDPAALETLVRDCGAVLHLAGAVRARKEATFDEVNRGGTERLVDAMARFAGSARLVHVSSLAAAGPASQARGVAPDDPPAPVSAYGRSKLDAESAVRRSGLEWRIVRPPAIYGPRDTDVFEFFKMVHRGVALLPAGQRWISVAWVGDVVRGILAAAAGRVDEGRILHLGEPEPYRLEALVRVLAAADDRGVRVVRVPAVAVRVLGSVSGWLGPWLPGGAPLTPDKARELLQPRWVAETAASLRQLGLEEHTSFPDGARRTWSWYRRQGWLR